MPDEDVPSPPSQPRISAQKGLAHIRPLSPASTWHSLLPPRGIKTGIHAKNKTAGRICLFKREMPRQLRLIPGFELCYG